MKLLKLEEMTTEQKLGMTFCARPSTDDDYEWVVEMIKKRALGCVQVTAWRKDRVDMIRAAADYPIIIVCDTESGFPRSGLPAVSFVTLAACNNDEYYELYAKGVVAGARQNGFNATWSPVVDVMHGVEHGVNPRKLSDDPMKVAHGAEIISRVFKRNGYMSGAKHYPGGQDMHYDSHMTAVHSNATEESLKNFDLIPYKHLIEKGLLPSIMTSHHTYRNIDPDHPGTLSPKVQNIIREMGFDGITFSDSLAMMAILQKYGEENVLGMAIAAGIDIVLPNYRTRDRVAFAQLVKNYEDGMFTEERLNEAARRVLAAHEFIGAGAEAPDELTDEDIAKFEFIARDSVTAVCDEGVSPALDPNKKHLFVVLTDNEFNGEDANMEIVNDVWYAPENITKYIRAEFPDSPISYLPEFPNWKDNEKILLDSAKVDDVVFVTFCAQHPYQGSNCLTRRVENLIDCTNMNGKLAAVVHFGTPSALLPLQHTERLLFGYNMPMAQPYTFQVLSGKIPAKGTLPVNLKFN